MMEKMVGKRLLPVYGGIALLYSKYLGGWVFNASLHLLSKPSEAIRESTRPIDSPATSAIVAIVATFATLLSLLSPNSMVIVMCDALLYSTCIDAQGAIEGVPAVRSRDDNRSRIIRH